MNSLFAPAFNFIILLIFLGIKLREPVNIFVLGRQKSIAADLEGAREQSRLAREKYAEFSAKLSSVHAEVMSLRQEGRREAETVFQKTQVEAKKMAEAFLADASQSCQALFSELQAQLYRDLIHQVMLRSTTILKETLTDRDRIRMRSEFASQMEKAS